ncbi:velvet factor-domain-containing protein [Phycomyces nitens]|nr:velvet factor-domain-containing protein [Phycomyces nitens]
MNPFIPTNMAFPPTIDIEPEPQIYSYSDPQYFTPISQPNFRPLETPQTPVPYPPQLHMAHSAHHPMDMPPFMPDFESQLSQSIGTDLPLTYDYHNPYTIEGQAYTPVPFSYHNQSTESSGNQSIKAEPEFASIVGNNIYSDYDHQQDCQLPLAADTQPSIHDYTFGNHLPSAMAFSNDERDFELVIVQQPLRARMCGFGDKDRRPISPPPILQLSIRTKDGQEINPENVNVSFFVVLCDSWLEDGKTEANLVYHSLAVSQIDSLTGEISQTVKIRNMVGSSVASATKLYDSQGNLGIYFVFHDISFRSEGRFRLGFSFIDIGTSIFSENSSRDNHQISTQPKPALEKVFTNPFTVYTAKQFPGVAQSTLLSQCFARQGVKIPIRKDTKPRQKIIKSEDHRQNIKAENNGF